MDYDVGIYHLSRQFFTAYPYQQFPEIERKSSRPYSCLLVEYFDDLFLCIPFRSHIRHKYAYHFKNFARALRSQSGLDYTKSILIKDLHYLDLSTQAVVDPDEYKETMINLPRIVREVYRYLSDYTDDLNGIQKLHPKEWQRRYGKSTLPYFNDFLTAGP